MEILNYFRWIKITFLLSLGMKRSLSPVEDEDGSLTEQTGLEGVSSEGVEVYPPINSRPKRERKHRSYTLCEVCNIQLNSAAQAQIHYNGKTHQKRLKHINNSNKGMMCVSFSGVPVITGASCITLSTQIRHVPGSTFWKCLSGNKSVTSNFGDSF